MTSDQSVNLYHMFTFPVFSDVDLCVLIDSIKSSVPKSKMQKQSRYSLLGLNFKTRSSKGKKESRHVSKNKKKTKLALDAKANLAITNCWYRCAGR